MKLVSFSFSYFFFCLFFLSSVAFGHMKSLHTAATGMAAQEAMVNTISHNIANVNTHGFKRSRTEFEDLLYENRTLAGARSSADTYFNVNTQFGSGVKVGANRLEFTQGVPKITNNPFDLMIQGEGFLGMTLANGEIVFTRDGSFSLNPEGVLVTREGIPVFPGITIPANTQTISIAENGTVDCFLPNQTAPVSVGQIPVFVFVNPNGLLALGGNKYQKSLTSGEPIQMTAGVEQAGVLKQGMIENSNVNILEEMTSLLRAQRSYELNSKVLGIADQMLGTINNVR